MLLSKIACAALVLLLAISGAGQNISKPKALAACSSVFGATVDVKLNLFEVNSMFILEPRFDVHDNLTALSVFPKYFLEEQHPEWTEPPHWPLLSEADYQILLARTDRVVAKGNLIAAGLGGTVTNSTYYPRDRYERAYVIRGQTGDMVRFFDVYPIHQIEGTIRKRRHRKFLDDDFYQVLVGKLNYLMVRADYLKLGRGSKQKFSVVGPIQGYCYAGFCNP